ncbi:uncharacterized protein LOC118188500 [Stegodyphus dumicola]|uniref:uncharacterized protein LOC118188500 n=1 Tax=Stegodyphus dumicola TaxID=202533 RepID=UPI0015A9AC09|nr:uncharacterized protein LOC118188500 [Stegodyphus dumicola]
MKSKMKVMEILITFVLILATMTQASITWRRVTKSNSIRTTEKPVEALTTPKSSVIWKRSTLSRRSTPDEISEEPPIDEEDLEYEEADPKEDVVTPDENDKEEPSIKPLVPGSRPGFWFDSARRRKPSNLLRPGSRRNSLFPSKATAAPTSTTESVTTALPITPLTPPALEDTTTNKDSAEGIKKLFGRKRPTKPSISFRKRPKTTKTPSTSSTIVSEKTAGKITSTESAEILLVDDEEIPLNRESGYPKKERNSSNISTTKSPPRSLGLGTRRRIKNGTRLSWNKKSDQLETKTTSVPQQLDLTTTSSSLSTKDFNRLSRRPTSFPRSRSRIRSNKTTSLPHVSWSRSQKPTEFPNVSTTESYDIKESEKSWTSQNYIRNRNAYKFNRIIANSTTEVDSKLNASNIEVKSETEKQNSRPPKQIYPRTTVEPFYITRDYGRLVTAIPDLKDVKETPYLNITNTFNAASNTKTEITTTENFESTLQDDTLNDHLEFNEVPFMTTTMKSTPKHQNVEYHKEKIVQDLPTSTATKSIIRPPTVPPTVDPGNNAYVVWSVGQGGSGWTYEKHGDQVKWSAQNSAAEGDWWSVTRKDVETTPEAPLWEPVRNINQQYSVKLNETLSKTSNTFKEYFKDIKSDSYHHMGKTSFVPNVSYRNETLLSVKAPTEPFSAAPHADTAIFSQLPEEKTFLHNISSLVWSKPAIPKEFPYFYNSTLLNSEILDTNKFQYPRINDTENGKQEKELNEQIFRLPNEDSPHVSVSVPYMAEIRETFNNVPSTATSNNSNIQEYVTEIPVLSEEKTTFSQQEVYPVTEVVAQNTPSAVQPYFQITHTSSQNYADQQNVGTQVLEPITNQGRYQRIQDLFGIPPALAKAVVESKRWRVVGSGGEDGWSLLGENGELEWKIHNIDGKWRITSADEWFKMNTPLTELDTASPEKEQKTTENDENKQDFKQNTPKVWTLEDDYKMWKAVSSENGEPVDDSPEEWAFNPAYDYDRYPELPDDYYSNDYFTSEPVVEQIKAYPSEDFEERPIWGTGSIEMMKLSDGYSQQYGGALEHANTKEDAIAAWKSLLAEQGKWKLSHGEENIGQITKPAVFPSSYDSQQSIPLAKYKDWKISPQSDYGDTNKNKKQEFNSYSLIHPNFQEMKLNKDRYNYENFQPDESMQAKYGSFEQDLEQNKNEFDGHEGLQHQNASQKKHLNHSKIDSLINKLEMIQRNAKGKAVVDLAQLLKVIKANKYSSKNIFERGDNLSVRNPPEKRYSHIKNTGVIEKDYQSSLSNLKSKSKELESDQPSLYSNFQLPDFNEDPTNTRNLNSNVEEKRFNSSKTETSQLRPLRRYHKINTNNHSNRNHRLKPSPKMSYKIASETPEEQYVIHRNTEQRTYKPSHNLPTYTQQPTYQDYHTTRSPIQSVRYYDVKEKTKYRIATSASPIQFKTISTTDTHDEGQTSSEEVVNYRDKSEVPNEKSEMISNIGIRRSHRPNKKRPRRLHNSAPIILSGETEIEDEEDGSKKSRKIIVIDYAGRPKRKSSVERKDLELIIRNVKKRRSELLEDKNGKR